MPKKLVLCYDGTWNSREDNPTAENDTNTNVVKLFDSITKQPDSQLAMYDQGVGSRWYDKIAGGVAGFGIDLNIMQGYAWLADHYRDRDEIFLFGFSRGAYTARSLAGMLFHCGLLPSGNPIEVALLYEKYRKHRLAGAVSDVVLAAHSRIVQIKFVGVWDTVGALGIPLPMLKDFDNLHYSFHDVSFHENVENAYHAIAVDEHRDIFDVTLWDPASTTLATMEQRWFVGAHGDVGGGYTDGHQWPRYTLRWMQEKAKACGLDLESTPAGELDLSVPIHDSYSEFLDGVFADEVKPLNRTIGRTEFGNEVIDDSVHQKIAADPNYRPDNQGL